jgi:hypothetical protein
MTTIELNSMRFPEKTGNRAQVPGMRIDGYSSDAFRTKREVFILVEEGTSDVEFVRRNRDRFVEFLEDSSAEIGDGVNIPILTLNFPDEWSNACFVRVA